MPASLSAVERRLLALLQGAFPLVPEPFAALAGRLGWREREVLERIRALKTHGALREISAVFDTRRLGYTSTLVALSVEAGRLDEVAAAVSRHPGVSHNYGREHAYNLWFTLAVPPGADLGREVAALSSQRGVLRRLSLPVVRTFKIDARLSLGGEAWLACAEPDARQAPAGPLPEAELPFVRALQVDLPLEPRPFAALARQVGAGEAELLAAARRLLAAGIMRRYGATLRHRQAGYTANAMVCWQVAEECIVAAGEAAAAHPAVSHCYQRRTCPPEWPYQVYTMVHARSEEGLAQAIAGLRAAVAPEAMAVLATRKEYKKARLRYFAEGLTLGRKSRAR